MFQHVSTIDSSRAFIASFTVATPINQVVNYIRGLGVLCVPHFTIYNILNIIPYKYIYIHYTIHTKNNEHTFLEILPYARVTGATVSGSSMPLSHPSMQS